MAETPTCMGCFVNNPFSLPYGAAEKPGLTADEKLCLTHLADAWTIFDHMLSKHPDDDNEFRKAIHDAQKLIALRVARRVDTNVWKQPE